MKKFLQCLSLFLLLGLVGCPETPHMSIVELIVQPVALTNAYDYDGELYSYYRKVDEFTDKITFLIYGLPFKDEDVSANKFILNTTSRCYAWTTPEPIIDNHLVGSTLTISFDRSFVYMSDVIESGEDILQYPNIKKEAEIHISDRSYSQDMVKFSDSFAQNAEFEDEFYLITFSCDTSDKQSLQATASVKFSLK